MQKLTNWEKQCQANGSLIIPFTHDEIVDHLLQVFNRDRDHLLLKAAADNTKRHELVFVLDYENLGDKSTIFGGAVAYNKKKKRFTYISYSDRRNWAVFFSIESKAAFFAYEFHQSIKHVFPLFYSIKKLSRWLLDN